MSNTIKPIIFDLNDVRKKAENGDKFACYILGRSYDSEENGAEQSFEKAMYWYGKGKELGDPRSAYGVGACYYFQLSGFFMVLLVVLAIACYAMSLGPVTWVLLSEIFPDRVRGVAMATATFALWIGCFTLTYTFPLLNASLGSSGTFWIYALICAVSYVFLYCRLPETKGKSLEKLERELI